MTILNQTYSREAFVKFLEDDFLPEDFCRKREALPLSGKQNFVTEACRLGECKSLELEVFEVHHTSLNDARVGIAKDAFRMLLHHSYCNRALVAFVPSEGGQWRFSLLQMEAEINDRTNRIQRSYSNPRRYSFLLGENSAIKTPTQFLIEKGRVRERQEGNKRLSPFEDLVYRFSIEALTKEFYNKLYNWFLWAKDRRSGVTFPNKIETDTDDRDKMEVKMIRLITRMLFVWFIKQKHLVPGNLFDIDFLATILRNFHPEATDNGDYYNAILQNLFFATLNQEFDGRKLLTTYKNKSPYYSNKQLYRDTDKSYFTFPVEEREKHIKELFKEIPYLNGGLFECLDKYELDENDKIKQVANYDGFSHENIKSSNGNFKKKAFIPNALFFSTEHHETVTIKEATADKPEETQDITVMGLIELFKQYNFTVEENTTSDVEVSLDPELLGRVFENLLAAYNPETQESARKSTGSYYTPREIVDYMVEESLIAYLSGECGHDEAEMRSLVKGDSHQTVAQPDKVIEDLKNIKVLDPACGSGAFPIGVLLKITDIIERLTPEGQFNRYDTKLEIIKKCIYGVDIQPIAMLICKLRFFISLICDCEKDPSKPNFGIIPLPNLETKFVAANSLLPAKVKAFDNDWTQDDHLRQLQKELLELRQGIFDLRTHAAKRNNKIKDREKCHEIKAYIRQNATQPNAEKVARLEKQIADCEAQLPLYEGECWVEEMVSTQTSLFEAAEPSLFRCDVNKEKRDKLQADIKKAKAALEKELNKTVPTGFEAAVDEVTEWDPYNQNAVAPFFDAEWMFGIGVDDAHDGEKRPSKQGFDIVIGNPPYISHDNIPSNTPCSIFQCFEPFADIYCYFYEKGISILASGGILTYITSNSFLRANYGLPLRQLIHEKCDILQIIDIEGTQVFGSAVVNTAISSFKKSKNESTAIIVNAEWLKCSIDDFVKTNMFEYRQCDFDLQPWTLSKPMDLDIRRKIEKAGKTLEDLNTKIRLGLATGDNNAFILNEEQKQKFISQNLKNAEIIKPVIRGQDIKRYCHSAPLYLLLTKNGIDVQNEYPIIYNYLDSFGEKFKQRGAKGQHWSNLRACAFFDDFKKEKIIWIELTDTGRFSLSRKEEYLLNSAYFLLPPLSFNAMFLLGVLNSSIIRFFVKQIAATSGMGTLRWINNYIKLIPVPEATAAQQQPIIDIVDKILSVKKVNSNADTSKWEKQIDVLAYDLYGLNEDEIRIVEGRS